LHHRLIAVRGKKGVVILPGLGNSYKDYEALAEDLSERDFDVQIAQVIRADWLRNSAGLTDPAYWKGTLQPRPTVDWYLNKVRMDAPCHRARDAMCCAHSRSGVLI
jgi:hypothetical protein